MIKAQTSMKDDLTGVDVTFIYSIDDPRKMKIVLDGLLEKGKLELIIPYNRLYEFVQAVEIIRE